MQKPLTDRSYSNPLSVSFLYFHSTERTLKMCHHTLYAVSHDGERSLLMVSSDNPMCCGRYMFRVASKNPYWDCQKCGTRKNSEGRIIATGNMRPNDGSSFDTQINEHESNRAEAHDNAMNQDGSEKHGHEEPETITDYEPRCWKCSRLLGSYFTRPWCIRCRRCKASNSG